MTARNTMLDSLGIYQHHDAITGTGKDLVAADYIYRMGKSMDKNNKLYSKYLRNLL